MPHSQFLFINSEPVANTASFQLPAPQPVLMLLMGMVYKIEASHGISNVKTEPFPGVDFNHIFPLIFPSISITM
jgi:hypothetical protein